MTEYEYDEAGRLVGSVTMREPEYSRTDVEALIAFLESRRVGPHGQPMSEATSPDANPQNPHRKYGYEVEAWTDFAAKAKSEAIRDFKAKYGDDVNMDEIRFIVNRVDY